MIKISLVFLADLNGHQACINDDKGQITVAKEQGVLAMSFEALEDFIGLFADTAGPIKAQSDLRVEGIGQTLFGIEQLPTLGKTPPGMTCQPNLHALAPFIEITELRFWLLGTLHAVGHHELLRCCKNRS